MTTKVYSYSAFISSLFNALADCRDEIGVVIGMYTRQFVLIGRIEGGIRLRYQAAAGCRDNPSLVRITLGDVRVP